LDVEGVDAEEGFNGEVRFGVEAVSSNDIDEKVFAAFDVRATEVGEKGFEGREFAGTAEAVDDGVVGVVIVGKTRVEFSGVVEDLEGKVEILLASDHGDQALRVETLRPGFDWWCYCVGFEDEVWIHGGESTEADGGDRQLRVAVT
jgi:hypothetical protein